jgi:sporulation protein YlmC with PRC-barrel domain
MKKTLLAGAVAFALAASALAQTDRPGTAGTTGSPGTGVSGPGAVTHDRQTDTRPIQTMGRVRASNLVGATVEDHQGNNIGEIEDLLLERNNIVAVVSVGGFLGLGEKRVAVPYDKLQISRDGDKVKVGYAATKEQLQSAHEFRYDEPGVSRRQERTTQ